MVLARLADLRLWASMSRPSHEARDEHTADTLWRPRRKVGPEGDGTGDSKDVRGRYDGTRGDGLVAGVVVAASACDGIRLGVIGCYMRVVKSSPLIFCRELSEKGWNRDVLMLFIFFTFFLPYRPCCSSCSAFLFVLIAYCNVLRLFVQLFIFCP